MAVHLWCAELEGGRSKKAQVTRSERANVELRNYFFCFD